MTKFEETLKRGLRIYYNGDMANEEGFGIITSLQRNKWGTFVDIKMDDGRTFPSLSIAIFSEEYLGHGGTRFVTEEAYKKFKQAAVDKIKAQLKKREEGRTKSYREKISEFLDYSWQEDGEIDFVSLIEENRDRILNTPTDGIIKHYLKRLWEGNRGQMLDHVSDRFVYELCQLVD